ncbi:ROK family protein, partial [bacterium]|nr:ROK family protein [bacterium]
KMLAVVYDKNFKPLGRKRRRTKGHEGVKAGLERIAETIELALEEAGVKRNRVRGIGVGCPGPLDLDAGVILEAPNLGWENAPLKKYLTKHFNCEAAIANDVDAGVYGEYRFGAGKKARCVIGVFPGTGIGGGCVYEGKIFRGRVTSCMEVGFMKVMSDGPKAGVGCAGSLEAVASRLAISSQCAVAAFRGQAPNLREKAGTDLSNIRSGVLASAIEAGDKEIERIVRDAAGHVGHAVGSLVNILAPDIVVLGGGLVEALPDLYLTAVRKKALQTALPSYHDTFEVVAAKLGDDASVLGAAAWIEFVSSQKEHAEQVG